MKTRSPRSRVTVTDESDLRKYRTELPNIIDDLELSVFAYRLYGHYKRRAGANGGECTEGMRATSKHCKIAINTVRKARNELVERKLITVRETTDKTGRHDFISIVDIWPENFRKYAREGVSPRDTPVSQNARGVSPRDTGGVSPRDTEERTSKERTNEEGGDFLSKLKAKPLYARLDLDTELAKAETWAAANHKRVTPRFFVNWINRSLEHLPLNGNGNGSAVHDAAWHARQAELARRAGRVYRPDAS